ncbi:hypothetical protein [Chelatococcus asaccharovorans]|uniref:Uncharacterized protein n=1 Tax=Chelatococcus asaccharovorans TaxID=28210 RepID=A0A2V3TRI7_9HYPH|nr:hypothetical protein [Chelatococcus asaccharovorans]MBS7705200.1 hypothetical protein [Chelatococcus asaccharovorans]MBS7707977.1 hypothetical protein [Chelatococcus asaccharovorans]PXW49900.1 hypothetical protein C7450_1381 [Chelatococcus asaccharovorans]
MAAVSHLFTLAYVAELLGEGEDWLHEISIEMEPEDGLIGVYGVGNEYTLAFTDFGIENLRQLVEIHKQDAARDAQAAAGEHSTG